VPEQEEESAGSRRERRGVALLAEAEDPNAAEAAQLSRLTRAAEPVVSAMHFPSRELGPEFVTDSKPGRVHCAVWTHTVPQPPAALCGVVCRLEEACEGFSVDSDFGWCLWYDRLGWPQSALTPDGVPCSNVTNAVYLKKEKGPYDFKTWAAIKKVHVLESRLGSMLGFDILHPFKINGSQVLWNPYDPHFEEVLGQEGDGYQWDHDTVLELRNALVNASDEAYGLANEQPSLKEVELKENPPSTTPPPTLEPPEEEDSWETKWSKEFPDCPMGAPCFCDCRCREPSKEPVADMASLPTPCPPPPTPNPRMVGMPQDAQGIR
jgi:hypothetical protein